MSSDSIGTYDFFTAWKSFTEKMINNQDPIVKEFISYSQEFTKLLRAANKDVLDRADDMQAISIAIKEEGEDKPKYSAQIRLDGDWVEQVPKLPPKEDDVYWQRFKENVNKVREERKEMTNKAMEVAGASITKVVNPISFSLSDLSGLVGAITNATKK